MDEHAAIGRSTEVDKHLRRITPESWPLRTSSSLNFAGK